LQQKFEQQKFRAMFGILLEAQAHR